MYLFLTDYINVAVNVLYVLGSVFHSSLYVPFASNAFLPVMCLISLIPLALKSLLKYH